MSTLCLTVASIDPRARDVKALHDAVIQAALAGEAMRPVLWATPAPGVLIVRHDRPLDVRDFPAGLNAASVRHAPYWLPARGQRIEWAVIVDGSQSGQTKAQWEARVAAGLTTHAAPRPSKVRSPEQVRDVVARRLSAAGLTDVSATVAGSVHLTGRRGREGRVQHSNQVHLTGAGDVTDPQSLHALMVEGVGRNRGFGCGLIIAKPAAVESIREAS